jgi:hypothetical protein
MTGAANEVMKKRVRAAPRLLSRLMHTLIRWEMAGVVMSPIVKIAVPVNWLTAEQVLVGETLQN